MDRRTLLHGLAAGSAGLLGAVAGCTSGGDGGSGGGNGNSDDGSGADTTAGGGGERTAGGETTADSSSTTSGGAATSGGTNGRTTSTVTVASVEPFGDILTDDRGMTLYLFTEDDAGESVCYDDCAATWPPLTVEGEPAAGGGVTADLGTTTRTDGSKQATVAGHPLYYYAPDEQPGDTNGQGVGGVWFVVAPTGSKIAGTGTDTGSGTAGTGGGGGSSGGGGGY